MRDPARIKRICELLEKAWSNYPDQRFGQFLINYVYGSFKGDFKVYPIEDDIVEQKLLEFFEKRILK